MDSGGRCPFRRGACFAKAARSCEELKRSDQYGYFGTGQPADPGLHERAVALAVDTCRIVKSKLGVDCSTLDREDGQPEQTHMFEQAINKGCASNGVREWHAIITGGSHYDWTWACQTTKADIDGHINGQFFSHPKNCYVAGASALGNTWGEWDVAETSCNYRFEPMDDKGCAGRNQHKWHDRITGEFPPRDWVAVCNSTTARIANSNTTVRPNTCWRNWDQSVWGEFIVTDGSCH